MASNHAITDTIQTVTSHKLSPSEGAAQIAEKVNGSGTTGFESALNSLWSDIMSSAIVSQSSQPALVDLLVSLSQQPDPKDDSGNSTKLYSDQGWCDLPMFGWKINELWNSKAFGVTRSKFSSNNVAGLSLASSGEKRSEGITKFVNGVHFTALLIKTGQSVFQSYKLQILWTFRDLESPTTNSGDEAFKKLDATIPAIATVVDVFGQKIGMWDIKYRVHPGGGSPARGGPLWTGEQGFNKQRYTLWKTRLQEISEQDNVDPQLKRLAAETATKM